MAYSGRYTPKNKEKYIGNANKVFYRSLWELQVFRWCDMNSDVLKWQSEEHIIPYKCPTDGRWHRYFPDVYIQFKNGTGLLVEIKPKSQTKPPEKRKFQRKETFLNEAMTWAKNESKWLAADTYAKERGWKFQIWTEKTLRMLGIYIEKMPKD